MKVNLRKRKTGKRISLYLDVFVNGTRRRETLGIYLNPEPKSTIERKENRDNLELAENVRARRQLELLNEELGFESKEKRKASFIVFLHNQAERRMSSINNYGNWRSMIKHFIAFAENDVTFIRVNRNFCQRFKDYLEHDARTPSKYALSQNSKYSYYNKFKAALVEATKQGYFVVSPCESIPGFKQGEVERAFLSLEEVKLLAKTECPIPVLKSAFLFSCLTGMRWSDINKLTWSEVQSSEEIGSYVRFRQKKTKGVELLPISDQALALLGERGEQENIVFVDLKYSARNNQKLQKWVFDAGITKSITFHCARHTFATLQLSNGTDLYTVSKLLGHREIKTTQVYTKVIDEKKIIAVNKIKL